VKTEKLKFDGSTDAQAATVGEFPIIIKAGGTTIRILYNPLVVAVEPSTDADGNNGKHKTVKTYPSYLVEYYEGSRVIRKRRSTLAKARAVANDIKTRILSQDVESVSLLVTGRDRRVYLAAMDHLAGIDKKLDEATKEYSDAIRALAPLGLDLAATVRQAVDLNQRLHGTSLSSIVDFYERHGRKLVICKKVPEIAGELVAALTADHKGGYHTRDLAIRLGRFGKAFPGSIQDISTKQIDEWLRGLRSESKHIKKRDEVVEIAGKTRNHYRDSVVQLFNFARDAGYLPQDLKTAAESTSSAKEEPSENEIFVPQEMHELLNFVPPRLAVSMAIKAFSGVRTEEIAKIEWEMLRFEQDCIILPARITKLSQRRTIALKPNLKAWLEPFRNCKGRVCTCWATPQGIFQAWQRYAVKQGIQIGGNRFRNSFISFRVAETRDIQLVAMESGNSPAIIQREYLELAAPQDAQKWFSIMPSAEKKAELEVYAKELLEIQHVRGIASHPALAA
jgi:integrase